MTRQATGWAFVGVQFALLIALAVLSSRPGDAWPTPAPLLAISALCTLGGLAVIVIAALQLGRSLTATPVPNARNELSDTGLYGMVRHPIYSGVLLVVIGLALRSSSWVTAAVAIATIVFFSVKARWEERQLAERHADYPAYCARVPRFVPRPARSPH
jgi:protein-S-isoprenylcysteine O-methyltransferase Ste14